MPEAPSTYLPLASRSEFREWLAANHAREKEIWIRVKRGRPRDPETFWYLDAVEEALCFGWIDSTFRTYDTVGALQRFTPRKPRSNWTELNKERVRRLERLGLMTDAGRAVLPRLGRAASPSPPKSKLRSRPSACGAASAPSRRSTSEFAPPTSPSISGATRRPTRRRSRTSSNARGAASYTASGTITAGSSRTDRDSERRRCRCLEWIVSGRRCTVDSAKRNVLA